MPALAILRVRSARTPGWSSTSTTTTSRSRVTARWEMARECLAASACLTRMCSSARSPGPTQVAAAILTPASLIAAATWASAPAVFSISMTRSTAMAARSSHGAAQRDLQPRAGLRLGERRQAAVERVRDALRVGLRQLGALAGEQLVDGRRPQDQPALEVRRAQLRAHVQRGMGGERSAGVRARAE